jgi:hypothetical protein
MWGAQFWKIFKKKDKFCRDGVPGADRKGPGSMGPDGSECTSLGHGLRTTAVNIFAWSLGLGFE